MGAGHSHGHSHGHGHPGGHRLDGSVPIGSGARRALLTLLVLAAVATIAGVVALWPDSDAVDAASADVAFAAPGVTFPRAEVRDVAPACPVITRETGDPTAPPPDAGTDDGCGLVQVRVAEGAGTGRTEQVPVPPQVSESGLKAGDRVRLMRVPGGEGQPASFSYFGTERGEPLLLLAGLFVVVVVSVAWHRGLFALVGLGFAAWFVTAFLLPAVLSGEPALLVGLVACSAIMYVVLYTTHGFSVRTSTALMGTLVGLGIGAGLGQVFVRATRLTGVTDEGASVLQSLASGLDFSGLLTCAVMIAGLGVLNDVTITQASSVWELRAASPAMSRARVWTGAMRIGRDHVASAIYTIAFAYAGAALTLLLVLQLYGLPMSQLLATEEIAEEIVRTLVTSLGLVLAMPVTTAIAAALARPADPETRSPT